MKFTESLKKSGDFSLVFKLGRAKGNGLLVVFVKENGLDVNRLGITISKKMGKAVVRNKIRRRIKEAYRALEPGLVSGYDIIVLPKAGSYELKNAKFAEILRGLKKLMERQGLYG
jgi:ribonuclease P protein component